MHQWHPSTQGEFTDLCKMNRSCFGGIEGWERNLTLLNVIKICDTLKVNPSDILSDLGKWPKHKAEDAPKQV